MAVRASVAGTEVPPSGTALAFGARVSIPLEGSALFLVVGRADGPDAVVRRHGGRVMTHLQDRRKVLAVLPLASWMGLRAHRDIASAGPVGIDQDRFQRFAELSGVDE